MFEVFQSKMKYRKGEKKKTETQLGKNKEKEEEATSRLMALGNM